jgi:hypothetical protein
MSHRYGYPHGYLSGEHREPALLVDEQINRHLPAWQPYTKVVAQAIEHVVPTISHEVKRPRQIWVLCLNQAGNKLLVHVDVGRRCFHRSIIRQALNAIKIVWRRNHSRLTDPRSASPELSRWAAMVVATVDHDYNLTAARVFAVFTAALRVAMS